MKKVLILLFLIGLPITIFSQYNNEGVIHYYHKGRNFHGERNFIYAINSYDKALSINKNYAPAYYGRGLAFVNIKKYNFAIKDFSLFIKMHPDLPKAYYYRGLSYYHKQKYSDALKDLNSVISIDRNFVKAYNMRGLANHHLGKYVKSIEDFTHYLAHHPTNDPFVYYYRGRSYEKLGINDEAIKNFKAFIRLSSNSRTNSEVKEKINELSAKLESK